jgi:16S rRNA processing protein RimM
MCKLIPIATLGKAVGLHGDMKCYLSTDFPEQLRSGCLFFLNTNDPLIIEYYLPDRDLIKFSIIHTREAAQRLTNRTLFTTMEQTLRECRLSVNEYFWFDILGCEVFEHTLRLGVVKDIHRLNADDYLEIMTDQSLVSKNMPATFLIPYIQRYIVKTDIHTKTIQTHDAYLLLKES